MMRKTKIIKKTNKFKIKIMLKKINREMMNNFKCKMLIVIH